MGAVKYKDICSGLEHPLLEIGRQLMKNITVGLICSSPMGSCQQLHLETWCWAG